MTSLQIAYQRGFSAGFSDERRLSCPYRTSSFRDSWHRGWTHACRIKNYRRDFKFVGFSKCPICENPSYIHLLCLNCGYEGYYQYDILVEI